MSRLLVLTALDLEARGLARELGLAPRPSSPFPRFAGGGIEVVPVGLRAARLGARWPGDDAALVISAGTCGALSPALARPGALVVPQEVLTAAGVRLAVDPDGHARALAAAARAGRAASAAPLVTADAIVESPEAKAALARATGAAAVDMESALILAAAALRGVPAVVVRAVSDTVGQRVPRELGDLVDDEGRPRRGRAVVLALRRPALIGRALALQRGSTAALAAVARVLAELLEARW